MSSQTVATSPAPEKVPTFKETVLAAEMFLKELGKGIPPDERVMVGYAEEATVQTDEHGKKKNAGWWPSPWLHTKPIRGRTNCYVCISSSIKTPNAKGEMRYWRGETSFGHGLALMVDDIGRGRGSKGELSIADFFSILPPTAVVETSPGNHQLWYFLDKPEPSMVYFKAFLRCFVDAVLKKGGDTTIRDVSRYGRMPCGINNKRVSPDGPYKYPGDGSPPRDGLTDNDVWRVRLKWWRHKFRYSIAEIAEAFKFDVVVPAKRDIDREQIDVQEARLDAYYLILAERMCSRLKMGEGGGGTVSQNMSGKFRIQCPWGHLHTNGDPFGAYFRGAIPGADHEYVFGCAHDTCRKDHRRTWSTFVDDFLMPFIYDKLETANTRYANDTHAGMDWLSKTNAA
jgi:hypothetical protein